MAFLSTAPVIHRVSVKGIIVAPSILVLVLNNSIGKITVEV